MTAIVSYSTLIENVKQVLEDDGLEFVSYLPTAVDLAEERLFKELDLPELEEKVTGSLTNGVSLLNKPSGYEIAEYFRVIESATNTNKGLRKKKEDFINDYWPDVSATGMPKYYADFSSTQFILAPTPKSGLTYELKHTKKPTKLSTSNETNYYIDNCKDVLYNAVCLEMVIFLKHASQIQFWESKYVAFRDNWNLQMARYRRDGSTTPMNSDNLVNSLKHTVQTNS